MNWPHYSTDLNLGDYFFPLELFQGCGLLPKSSLASGVTEISLSGVGNYSGRDVTESVCLFHSETPKCNYDK